MRRAMTYFTLKFFEDVVNEHITKPCRHHPRTFTSKEVAEQEALSLMPEIAAKFGDKAG